MTWWTKRILTLIALPLITAGAFGIMAPQPRTVDVRCQCPIVHDPGHLPGAVNPNDARG